MVVAALPVEGEVAVTAEELSKARAVAVNMAAAAEVAAPPGAPVRVAPKGTTADLLSR